jgi:ribosomal protein S4
MKTNSKVPNNLTVNSKFKTNLKYPNIGSKAVNKVDRNNFQQDPLMMKKSNKYRYSIKSFWTKRSDFSRGKYSRNHKFKALTGLYIDAKLKRSYNSKFVSIKFVAWKLGMSITELQTQLKAYRMYNGNTFSTFNSWLNTRLINILIAAGFYSNYHLAKQGIFAGNISINGVVVKDVNMIINIGDLICTLSNIVVSQQTVEGLLINSGTIYVKAIPNLVALTLATLNQEMFSNNIAGTLLDPMTHWLNYTTSFLIRGFNS